MKFEALKFVVRIVSEKKVDIVKIIICDVQGNHVIYNISQISAFSFGSGKF